MIKKLLYSLPIYAFLVPGLVIAQTIPPISPFIFSQPIPTIAPTVASSSLRIPSLASSNLCIHSNASGTLSAAPCAGAGSISGSGTSTQIAYFNSSSTLLSNSAFVVDPATGLLTVGGYVNASGTLYRIGVAPAYQPGLLFYEQTGAIDGLSFYSSHASSTLNIGKEIWKDVRNCNSGSPILDGTAVYLTGRVIGQLPCVLPASGDTLEHATVIGVTTEDIQNNTDGLVTMVGIVNGLNTSGLTDGDILYLASSTTGLFRNMTNIKPTAPYYPVKVGEVDYSHVTLGKIEINPNSPRDLTANKDFLITSSTLANGQVFKYDSSIPAWVNVATSSLGLQPIIIFPLPFASSTHLGALSPLSISGQNVVFSGTLDYASTTNVQRVLTFPLPFASTTPPTILVNSPLGAITLNGTTTISFVGTLDYASTTNVQKVISFPIPVASTSLAVSPSPSLILSGNTITLAQQINSTSSPTFSSTTLTGQANIGTFIDFPNIGVVTTTPAAGHVRLHAETTNGFTRLEVDDEGSTDTILGRDSIIIVKNTSGATLAKGTSVYITGSTGAVPNVSSTLANSTTTLPAIGLVLDAIANNNFGEVIEAGILNNFNTNAFATGDRLFVSPTTPGGITNVRPTYPNIVQRIGSVLNSGVGNGSIVLAVAPAELGRETGTISPTFNIGGSLAMTASSSPWTRVSTYLRLTTTTDGIIIGTTTAPAANTRIDIEDNSGNAYIRIANPNQVVANNTVLNIGYTGTYYPGIWFTSTPDVTNYAFLGASGSSIFNGPAGTSIYFRQGNTNRWTYGQGFAFGNSYYATDPGANNMIVEGNLGVGSNNPTYKLTVLGGDVAISNNQAYRSYDTGGTGRTILYMDNTNVVKVVNNALAAGGPITLNPLSGGAEAVRVATSGFVGINTSVPTTWLTVNANTSNIASTSSLPSEGATPPLIHLIGGDNMGGRFTSDSYGTSGNNFTFRSALGSSASPTALTSGFIGFRMNMQGWNGTAYTTGATAAIDMGANENWNATSTGTFIRFLATTNATTTMTEKMRLTDVGALGIGISAPATQLQVTRTAATTTITIGSGSGANRGKVCQWNGASWTTTSFAADSITPIYATSTACNEN